MSEELEIKINELNTKLQKLEDDKAYWEREAKESFGKRDEFKRKALELESKIAEGNKNVQELLESRQRELEALQSKLEETEKVKLTYEERIKAVEAQRRTELLSKVPEGLREKLGRIEDSDLLAETVAGIVEVVGDKSSTFSSNKPGNLDFFDPNKRLSDYTAEQLQTLKEKKPAQYETLLKSKYK